MSESEPISGHRELPPHIQDALNAISHLHADHARRATMYDKATDGFTGFIARPRFVAWLIGFVALWIGLNALAAATRLKPFDPPPYDWLQGVLAFFAVAFTCLVLASQRRADDLAGRRAQLVLELAILGELKTAKLIHLMEELRRDSPGVRDRDDPEAKAMATPTDTATVLEALTGTPDPS